MPRRPLTHLSLGLVCVGAALAAAATPASAGASLYSPTGLECRLASLVPGMIAGNALVDPLGYGYDTTEVDAAYGTLDDGSALVSGVRFSADAYDRFGALFVGDGQSTETFYRDPAQDADGCSSELAGRQLALKSVAKGDLNVQRRIFVSGTTGSGARLLDSVTNPTDGAITTNVSVGDLRHDPTGSLGSDAKTKIHASSSGDTTATADDAWVVTTDGRSIASDPALVHVWGGAGGALPVDLVRAGAGGDRSVDFDSPLDADQLGWGWSDVVLEPGQTRSFLSWEEMRTSADTKSSTQSALAVTAANELAAAPLSRVYEGLTAAQIGSVVNWGKPAATATLDAPTDAVAGTDVTLKASAVDFGSSKVAACSTGALEWNFGDGATATGATVTHRFAAAGSSPVTLTVRGTCGGTKVLRATVAVAAPTVPLIEHDVPKPSPEPVAAAPVPAAKPAGDLAADREAANVDAAPAAPALTLGVAPKLSASELSKRGVRPTLTSTAPGAVRLVLSGGGLKIVKTKQVAAGVATPAAMKLGAGDARRVKGLKSLQLRAKLTLATGGEVIVTRTITVGR